MKSVLKNLREKAGLSQGDVAGILGYSTPQFVSNWERGVSLPPFKAVKPLAKMYHSDVKFLVENLKDAHMAKLKKKMDREAKRL